MPSTRILLIEDNPADARLLREYLIEAGADRYQIVHAARLAEGIERLSSETFDVILLDLGLPDSQGLDSFYRLRVCTPNIPVILLTGLQDERTAAVAVQAGAQDYLNKNDVNQALLERTLHYAIDRQRYSLELQASEQRSRQIIDQNSTAILVLGMDNVILFANPAAAKIYGRPVHELLGLEFADPVSIEQAHEITILGSGNRSITVEMEVSRSTWEKQPVYLVSLHDVTARNAAELARQREQQITEALSELYKPLIAPTASLNDIAQEILRRACQLTRSSAGFISSFQSGKRKCRPISGGDDGTEWTASIPGIDEPNDHPAG